MLRKIMILMIVVISAAPAGFAGEPNDYIIPGRALLFNGTVSGLCSAYEVFDDGLNDSACVECASNRELIFLHAVTRIAMWAVRDNGEPIDSAVEYARQFDMELMGDYWQELDINYPDSNYPMNQHNAPEIPQETADIIEGVMDFIDTSAIPEIDAVINELNLITDSPGNRFRIFFDADETHMFFDPNTPLLENDVEVDYGDVLVLKGLLMALKGMLQSQSAYDLFVDANDMLMEKVYGDCFNVNLDLLLPHPDLLKVLPTVNDSNDGTAILAQARLDWITSINYYLDAINYISNENNPHGSDPQVDEFLYIDPNEKDMINLVNSRLIAIKDSISNDRVGVYPWKTKKIYTLQAPLSTTVWTLSLNYDIINSPDDEAGSFIASNMDSAPSPWKVTDISRNQNVLTLEMEYDVPGYWGGAFFSGLLSEDCNIISNGIFEYWGPAYGAINDFASLLTDTEVEEKQLDLNPIFGSSPRYPSAVNPRGLLPEFDGWNAALPGTVGHLLDNDATLGGILPDMTQVDWQILFDLQPSGLFYLQEILPYQKGSQYGYVDWWFGRQMVFQDIERDTSGDSNQVSNVDISHLYMGYDVYALYGTITLHDYNDADNSGQSYYSLYLSYSPGDTSTLDTIKLEIYRGDGYTYGSLFYMNNSYGYPEWEFIGSFNTRFGQNGIDFKVDWYSIPSYLPGRFISIKTTGNDGNWLYENGEDNETHLKIGDVGSVSGIVSYDGFKGDPIFIQAYTDIENPEDSIVAGTIITEPGPYVLDGIGLGWNGFIRAYTPLFGFDNPFELGAFEIQSSVPLFLMTGSIENVDIALTYPVELEKDVWKPGIIDSVTREAEWYYFDAVAGGTYTVSLIIGSAQYASISLYDRDADTELAKTLYWQASQINWLCPTSGRYYVKVADEDYMLQGGTYDIAMTNDIACPRADIASAQGAGVKDCRVDFYDLSVLISDWLVSCSQPDCYDEADFDESGRVDFVDFTVLANEWMENGLP